MENSKDMAQHTYDNEAVQELLNWAKKMIETKNYPTERYQVNQCTTIIDGGSSGKSGKTKNRSKWPFHVGR